MLIFGASISDWKEKARYAQAKGSNDMTKIHEVRCEYIENVDEAFAAMAAFVSHTQCKKFLYHATINLRPGERLHPAHWQKAVDTLETNLRLSGHYRVIFEHIKKNRQHYHIIWSRVPPGGAAAVRMSHNYRVHEATTEALEQEFGLVPSPKRKKSTPSHKMDDINRLNASLRLAPDSVRRDLSRAYVNSNDMREFVAALTASGYTLCRGKKRSLVVVDRKGGYHGLLCRIEDGTPADLDLKFPDMRGADLPKLNGVLRAHKHACTHRNYKQLAKQLASKPKPRRGRLLASGTRPVSDRPPTFANLQTLLKKLRRQVSEEDQTGLDGMLRIRQDKSSPQRGGFISPEPT
jgi:hypothetical protein